MPTQVEPIKPPRQKKKVNHRKCCSFAEKVKMVKMRFGDVGHHEINYAMTYSKIASKMRCSYHQVQYHIN